MAALVNALGDPPNWWVALYRVLVLAVVCATLVVQARIEQAATAASVNCASAVHQAEALRVEVAAARATPPPAP